MRRRSSAGGKPVKTRRRKAMTLKQRHCARSPPRRSSSAARQETKLVQLTGELEPGTGPACGDGRNSGEKCRYGGGGEIVRFARLSIRGDRACNIDPPDEHGGKMQ